VLHVAECSVLTGGHREPENPPSSQHKSRAENNRQDKNKIASRFLNFFVCSFFVRVSWFCSSPSLSPILLPWPVVLLFRSFSPLVVVVVAVVVVVVVAVVVVVVVVAVAVVVVVVVVAVVVVVVVVVAVVVVVVVVVVGYMDAFCLLLSPS